MMILFWANAALAVDYVVCPDAWEKLSEPSKQCINQIWGKTFRPEERGSACTHYAPNMSLVRACRSRKSSSSGSKVVDFMNGTTCYLVEGCLEDLNKALKQVPGCTEHGFEVAGYIGDECRPPLPEKPKKPPSYMDLDLSGVSLPEG